MKKFFLISSLFFLVNLSYCQLTLDDLLFDYIELSTNSDYHLFNYKVSNNEVGNNFNYGFSVLLHNQFHKRLRFSLGVSYNTKSFFKTYNPAFTPDFLLKSVHNEKYLGIPFLLTLNAITSNQINISLVNGIVLMDKTSTKSKYYFTNKPTDVIKSTSKDYYFRMVYYFGLEFEKNISEKFSINLSPYFNYILSPDLDIQNESMTENKYSIGLKLGVSYLLRKEKPY